MRRVRDLEPRVITASPLHLIYDRLEHLIKPGRIVLDRLKLTRQIIPPPLVIGVLQGAAGASDLIVCAVERAAGTPRPSRCTARGGAAEGCRGTAAG